MMSAYRKLYHVARLVTFILEMTIFTVILEVTVACLLVVG